MPFTNDVTFLRRFPPCTLFHPKSNLFIEFVTSPQNFPSPFLNATIFVDDCIACILSIILPEKSEAFFSRLFAVGLGFQSLSNISECHHLSHGTRCAGEVAAARDNGICGVGVAYDSKIAGIRMLDQPYMTDLIEANSMGHEPHKIHIYSASWGPTDDGKTVDGPRNATMRAIVQGVNEGRNGLGNIYVWASGDGGEEDDCNCDGYAASMWTISINSAINDGQNAHYDESCSSTLASTFSNGAKDPNTGVVGS